MTHIGVVQSPTLGAHTHAHAQTHACPWILGGHGFNIIVHGWVLFQGGYGWA